VIEGNNIIHLLVYEDGAERVYVGLGDDLPVETKIGPAAHDVKMQLN
jgi:hypothetical protein